MSFYSSIIYYRPTPAPVVKAKELGNFVWELRARRTIVDEGSMFLQIKYGDAIDADDEPARGEPETTGTGFELIKETYDWDVDLQFDSLDEILDAIANDEKTIYRANLDFGCLAPEVAYQIKRDNSGENEVEFAPYELSVELGPVECHTLDSDAYILGWIGLRISGYGYLWPWTLKQVVERVNATPALVQFENVCKSFWPVEPTPPEERLLAGREMLVEAGLWPYTIAEPMGWYWGLAETG